MSLLQVNTIRNKNGSSSPTFDRGVNIVGISTLGSVKIESGIITARSTTGIVTYYGDGRYLRNIRVENLDNLTVGIATIDNLNGNNAFFTGIVTALGGFVGDGSRLTGIGTTKDPVAISTTPPPNPIVGDLWYNPIYARTFIWYNEASVGVGSTAFWVDAAPFNNSLGTSFSINTTGIITASSFSCPNGFNINGNLNVNGDVTAFNFRSTSDINLKKNIKPLENSLDKVKSLNGVSFDWVKDDSSSIGFIAQEVEKIFPTLVEEVDGTKTVKYIPLIAVLVESVKELSKEVENLKSKLENS